MRELVQPFTPERVAALTGVAPETVRRLTREHCDLLGVSAVISADRESTEVICCAICKVKFHFLTEENRIVVTRVEPLEG